MIEVQLSGLSDSSLVFTDQFWSVVATEIARDLDKGLGYRSSAGMKWDRFCSIMQEENQIFASENRCFVIWITDVEWYEIEQELRRFTLQGLWIRASFVWVTPDWRIFERLRLVFGSGVPFQYSVRPWLGTEEEKRLVSNS